MNRCAQYIKNLSFRNSILTTGVTLVLLACTWPSILRVNYCGYECNGAISMLRFYQCGSEFKDTNDLVWADNQGSSARSTAIDMRGTGDVRFKRLAIKSLTIHVLLRHVLHIAIHTEASVRGRVSARLLCVAAMAIRAHSHVLAGLLGLPHNATDHRRRLTGSASWCLMVLLHGQLRLQVVSLDRRLVRLSVPSHQG